MPELHPDSPVATVSACGPSSTPAAADLPFITEALRPHAVPIGSLREDPANSRAHPEKNVDAIMASLRSFGQQKPAVVTLDGVVIAGNGTLRAATALGWTHLAVVETDLAPDAARAFALADNRTAELAEWDVVQLQATLASLPADLSTLVGWDENEMRRIAREADMALRSLADAKDADEVLEPPAVPTTRPGDLWILGEHRLVCGDSTKPDVVARVLDGDAPRLLLTDPPYGVELDMEWRDRAGLNALGPAQASYMRGEEHRTTSISGDTRADWSEAFELVPSLDTAYVWHASAFSIEVGTGLRRIGFELKQQIIWRKPHFALSRQHYHWQHEPCWYARREGAARFIGSRDQSTIWDAASPKMLMTGGGEEKFDHPTQKPVALYVRPIENHLAPGELLYEPFGGSGTAIAAAEMTSTRCRAVELDPKFCDVIVARWERLSGKKADRRTA
jgi:DNA modification methylase